MDLAKHLRGPRPSSSGGYPVCPTPTQTPTPRAAVKGGGITSRQILRGPDEDSLAVLLNDIHRYAQGFVERRVDPEISWRTRLQRPHPP